MKIKSQPKKVKFPENRELAAKLQQGDRVIIAEYAGLSPTTVRDMLNGSRRITDKAARAIIRLFAERQQLDTRLKEIAQTGKTTQVPDNCTCLK